MTTKTTMASRGEAIWTERGWFYPFDPRPEEVDLGVIATGLSRINRFNGHTTQPYSVAEHSIHCAMRGWSTSDTLAKACLLHDAAEAYLGDLVRPVKRAMPNFDVFEERVMVAICERFHLPVGGDLWAAVRDIDDAVLAAEREALLPDCPLAFPEGVAPAQVQIACLPHDIARSEFLRIAWMLGVS